MVNLTPPRQQTPITIYEQKQTAASFAYSALLTYTLRVINDARKKKYQAKYCCFSSCNKLCKIFYLIHIYKFVSTRHHITNLIKLLSQQIVLQILQNK